MHTKQTELIHKTNWKYLIILDACRYDYFKMCYKKFFDKNYTLIKVYSPGTWTFDWLRKTWTNKYDDIIYISANPFVSNKATIKGFCGGNHFFYVVDVWKECWNDNIGTVHPKDLTEISIKYINNYPEKRFVIHYLQPHAPFIEFDDIKKILNSVGVSKRNLLYHIKELFPLNVRRKVGLLILKHFGHKLYGFLFNLLNGKENTYHQLIVRYYGIDTLREYYQKNLELALKYVKYLAEHIKDNFIITSDHGELLGEYGIFAHPDIVYDEEIQLSVPWLCKGSATYIQKGISSKDEEDEELIKKRLKDLGYLS